MNKFFNYLVVVIIFFIIYLLYDNHISKNENFDNFNLSKSYPQKINYPLINHVKVLFLSKNDASLVLKKYHLHYFNLMEINEAKIRNIDQPSPNRTIRTKQIYHYYNNNILNFTNKEKNLLSLTISFIQNNLYSKKYNQLSSVPWNFIKVSDNIEESMPHTIYKYIVLPQRFLNDLLNLSFSYNSISSFIQIIGTLIHEQMHVFQKINPKIFYDLYQNYWNYFPCKIKLPSYFIKNQRINPDGLDQWCYKISDKLFLHPFVQFYDGFSNLNDVETLAIIIENQRVHYDKIDNIDNHIIYNEFFTNLRQNYHPHELSANILSDIIIEKINLNDDENCPAIKALVPWFKIYIENT